MNSLKKAAAALFFCLPLALTTTQFVHAQDCTYLVGPADAGKAIASSDSVGVRTAWYGEATTDYAHGVLGDAIEANILYAELPGEGNCAAAIRLPANSVFEDITPRIADVTGDGHNDVITIESHRELGASLAIYGIEEGQLIKLASTPYIGTAFRWLAPVGTADFTGDNIADVAYVETPHLAGILKIWSFINEKPTLIVSSAGFSNHRIGENFITGGIRHCGDKAELVIPDRQWANTLVANFDGEALTAKVFANNADPATIERALNCD